MLHKYKAEIVLQQIHSVLRVKGMKLALLRYKQIIIYVQFKISLYYQKESKCVKDYERRK